jgi:hypothetical protein
MIKFLTCLINWPIKFFKWIRRSFKKWWFWGMIIPIFLCFYWLIELEVTGNLNWYGLGTEIAYCCFALCLSIYLIITKQKRKSQHNILYKNLLDDYSKLTIKELKDLQKCYEEANSHFTEQLAIQSVLKEKHEERANRICDRIKK